MPACRSCSAATGTKSRLTRRTGGWPRPDERRVMAVAALALYMLLAGHAASEWLWRRDVRLGGAGAQPLERATSSAILALVFWIATNWMLSALGAVAPGALLASAAVAATTGAITLRRTRRAERGTTATR